MFIYKCIYNCNCKHTYEFTCHLGKDYSVPAFLSKIFTLKSNLGFLNNGRKQAFLKDDPFQLKYLRKRTDETIPPFSAMTKEQAIYNPNMVIFRQQK